MAYLDDLKNEPDFRGIKASIDNIKDSEKEKDWKWELIGFLNRENADDAFFFDYMEFIRFEDEDPSSVAYTTPDKLVHLNAPKGGGVGKKMPNWDFIYIHECLHQQWDTFKVADQITKRDGSCNHAILNIASDCVINTFINRVLKLDYPTDGLITPELLKEQYGVDYSFINDTQLSLYDKLMAVGEKLKKQLEKMKDALDPKDKGSQQGQSGQSGQSGQQGQSGQSGQSGQQGQQGSSAGEAQQAADEAQGAADAAKEAAKEAKKNGDPDAAAKASAAKEAQKAADEAKRAAERAAKAQGAGNEDKAAKEAERAKDAAQRAKDKAKEAGVSDKDIDKTAQQQQQGQQSQQSGNGKKAGNEGGMGDIGPMAGSGRTPDDVIKQYRNQISGVLGEFLSKCKDAEVQDSRKKSESSIVAKALKGAAHWDKVLNATIESYVNQRVIKKRKEYKKTYSRVNRRNAGPVEMGQMLRKGKKLLKDKLAIDMAYYIDASGSMGTTTQDVCKLVTDIANSINKKYDHDTVVDHVDAKRFAWTTQVRELDPKETIRSGSGGTMSLDQIFEQVKKHTGDYMINMILTDGEFGGSWNESKIIAQIKDNEGLYILVTDKYDGKFESLEKKCHGKMKYIYSNGNFKL